MRAALLLVLSMSTLGTSKYLKQVLKKQERTLLRQCNLIYSLDLENIEWKDGDILRKIGEICDPHRMRQKRYVRDDLAASEELTELARTQSDIIDQIVNSKNGDKRFFADMTDDDACRDWWFVIAPACFFIEGIGHDPSSSYPCCGKNGMGAEIGGKLKV